MNAIQIYEQIDNALKSMPDDERLAEAVAILTDVQDELLSELMAEYESIYGPE